MARLGPFEPAPDLAVAVSGGPDSMALALLARDWAAARRGRVLALIVDHRLRAGAAAEAALTRSRLASAGVPAIILEVAAPPPRRGIQAWARCQRYALLEEACRTRGILHLLLGHHAADQAETVAMRARRGAGRIGLAGMPAVQELRFVRLLRPLLAVERTALVAVIAAAGVAAVADPSNADPRFERARLRAAGLDPARWRARAAAATAQRLALERAVGELLAAIATPSPLGTVELAAAALLAAAPEIAELALARCLACIAGAHYAPRQAAVAALARALRAGARRRTLAGVILTRAGDRLRLVREPRAVRERTPLAPHRHRRWDGRFEVRTAGVAPGLEIRALGPSGWRALEPEVVQGLRRVGARPTVLAGLPGLWDGARLLGCPLAAPAGAAVAAVFAPRQPIAPAPFGAVEIV